MELILITVGFFMAWVAIETVKERDAKAEERSNERIMAAYLRAEDARFHRNQLAAIDRTVQATLDEMGRIAAEAQGEIVEGSCQEIEER